MVVESIDTVNMLSKITLKKLSNDINVDHLIIEVHQRKCLYDTEHHSYRNDKKQENIWSGIPVILDTGNEFIIFSDIIELVREQHTVSQNHNKSAIFFSAIIELVRELVTIVTFTTNLSRIHEIFLKLSRPQGQIIDV